MKQQSPQLSIVVPIHNEADGIKEFHKQLTDQLKQLTPNGFEVIYCDDGSTDKTNQIVAKICVSDKRIRLLTLSRNFGKEQAIAAGIDFATGHAVILMDGDGQHPISSLPDFVAAWHEGAQVVIGHRRHEDTEKLTKKLFSKLFYKLFKVITGKKLDPLATDYRLLDREVVIAYRQLAETDRLNRLLIDWLGFTRAYVPIARRERIAGTASYSFRKLSRVALDTMVSSSSHPLYRLCFLGLGITGLSLLTGIIIGIEQIMLGDPLAWNFTGTALLGILLIFLVGIVLTAQGVSSLYIATIYNQVKQRPLYIVNKKFSHNILEHSIAED
jgi:glycosyltransferase involved in cell wall biosynthesis